MFYTLFQLVQIASDTNFKKPKSIQSYNDVTQ
jgi:hypothetical protein